MLGRSVAWLLSLEEVDDLDESLSRALEMMRVVVVVVVVMAMMMVRTSKVRRAMHQG